MRYGSMFQPKVRSFDIKDEDGELVTFYYKRPRASELLDQRDGDEKSDPSSRERNERAIQQWIVHDDGSPIDKEELTAIMGMDAAVFKTFSAKLVAIMTPGEKKDGDAGKV